MSTLYPRFHSPSIALTIAGSDCSGGAGIQADLKSFHRAGVHGLSAVTCVVSETPGIVETIHPVPPQIVASQVSLLLDQYPVNAVKTGMLFSTAHLRAILPSLLSCGLPIIVDPVMIATSGDPLVEPDAIASYRDELCPISTLITPNLNEAAALLETDPPKTFTDLRDLARELSRKFSTSVLVKGGHFTGLSEAIDVLASADGELTEYRSPLIEGVNTHGTGCTLSAAITAALANGMSLKDAIQHGKNTITHAIAHSLRWPTQKNARIPEEMQALNLFGESIN